MSAPQPCQMKDELMKTLIRMLLPQILAKAKEMAPGLLDLLAEKLDGWLDQSAMVAQVESLLAEAEKKK